MEGLVSMGDNPWMGGGPTIPHVEKPTPTISNPPTMIYDIAPPPVGNYFMAILSQPSPSPVQAKSRLGDTLTGVK